MRRNTDYGLKRGNSIKNNQKYENPSSHQFYNNYLKSQKQTKCFQKDQTLTKQPYNPQDYTSDLLSRAKGLTQANQQIIKKTKKTLKISQQEAGNTFLTATGLYTQQKQEQIIQNSTRQEPDHNQMLRYLIRTENDNELQELRRMMKITRKNLNNYSSEIQMTKSQVINAAEYFHTPMDLKLTYNINKLSTPKRNVQTAKKKTRKQIY